jgi:hypothetical protein
MLNIEHCQELIWQWWIRRSNYGLCLAPHCPLFNIILSEFLAKNQLYYLHNCLVWCPGQSKWIAPLHFFHLCHNVHRIRLTVPTPEMDCDQTAILLIQTVFLIIISLLMSPLPGRRPSLWITQPPRGPGAGLWVLTTANAAGNNSLTCLPKQGGARDNKFLVTHPMTDQRCLTSAIARRSALTAGLSSSSYFS